MNSYALLRPRHPRAEVAPEPRCRLCEAVLTSSFVDLGATPLANAFVTPAQAALGMDRRWPLHVRVCDGCHLVQADAAVPADACFAEQACPGSISTGRADQSRRYAEAMLRRFRMGARGLVLQAGSNEGDVLQHFIAAGVNVLGIEPAPGLAVAARVRGVPTEVAAFGAAAARNLAGRDVCADLFVANDVLAQAVDPAGFVSGVALVLAAEGVATFEFPHLLRMIEQVQFDAIQHRHATYLSLLVVERLLAEAGLRAFDVEQMATDGGALRVFACHQGAAHAAQPGLAAVRAREAAARLDQPAGYARFAEQVAQVRRDIAAFLCGAQAARRRVAAYGASANGSIVLNACGITPARIPYVADRSPAKHGRLMPGCRIPIVSPETLLRERPDDVLILPWALAGEITEALAPLRAGGTRFWVAIPELRPIA